jgi:hypothetical protein
MEEEVGGRRRHAALALVFASGGRGQERERMG